MFRVFILLVVFKVSALNAQVLYNGFKPDFLKTKNVTYPINHWIGDSISFKMTLMGSEECCANFHTGKPMNNHTFQLTVKNKSKTTCYFVRVPQQGVVYPHGENSDLSPMGCGGMSAYVGIWSKKKSYRLDPGSAENFMVKTKMDYDSYYPIDEGIHDRMLAKDPKAFDPKCFHIMVATRSYNHNQIVQINAKHNAAKNKNKNNSGNTNTTNNTGSSGIDDIIGELEDDLETDINTASNKSNTPNIVDELASPVIPNTVNSPSGNTQRATYTYDSNLCSQFKAELNNWLNQTDRINVNNINQILQGIETFNNKRAQATIDNKLSPECLQQLDDITEEYYKQKLASIQGDLNKAQSEYAKMLNNLNQPNKKKPKFQFAPSTITPTYKKSTPSMKGDKFGKGKLKENKSKGVIPPYNNN